MGSLVPKSMRDVQAAKPKRDPWYEGAGSLAELCDYIVEGGHLAAFCREKGLKYSTVMDWINSEDHPDRAVTYARARETRADMMADQILTISNETHVDVEMQDMTVDGQLIMKPDGTVSTRVVRVPLNSDVIARNRLRVDSIKWLASRLKPKTYGDRITQEHTGAGGGPIRTSALDLNGLNDAELAEFERLMRKANGAAE